MLLLGNLAKFREDVLPPLGDVILGKHGGLKALVVTP